MYKDQRITVIIPCLNEEQGIEQVLRLELSADEAERLRRSAGVLKATLAELKREQA